MALCCNISDINYSRTERGGSRRIYWCASACQLPFSRAPAPAAVLIADASHCGIGTAFASVVFNQDEDTLTLKANKATTAPDLILNRWPSPRGAGPAKRSCLNVLLWKILLF
jgi:hypothetical protein